MSETMNIHETNGRSVTEVLPESLHSVDLSVENTRRELTALQRKYGANSKIGHRASNLVEMMKQLPPGPQHRIEYLTQDGVRYQRNRLLDNIKQQSAELQALLAAR